MIEMMIVAVIVAKVGLDSAGKFAVDVGFGIRGKASPRLTQARARRAPGAASRYWREVWDDAWTGASAKRAARKADQSPSSRPRGAATVFLSNLWRDGWVAAERRRSSKATRPRPGQETAPGTVVPNADERQAEPPVRSWIWRRAGWKCRICGSTQGVAEISFGEGFKRFNTRLRYCPKHMADYGPGGAKIDYGPESPFVPGQDGDRPQDRPVPEPRTVPTEDGGTDLRFGEDGDDPTGTGTCPECRGTVLVDGEICLSCRDRQEQRNQHHEDQVRPDNPPESGTDQEDRSDDMTEEERQWAAYERFLEGAAKIDEKFHPSPATPTTEGPTTMTTTMPTDTEVVTLNKAIDYCESTARVATEMIYSIDTSQSNLAAGGVTGTALAEFATAKEGFGSVAAAFERAAKEFKDQLAIQEAFIANPGAGTKEFIMGGR